MAAPGEYLFSTSLKWRADGELASRDKRAAHALVMSADGRPFELTPTQPMTYVALVSDGAGALIHVYGNANSWSNFHDQLEDLGVEVIENHTNEWDNDMEAIQEDCVSIQGLPELVKLTAYA
jgi:hypothetical protein